MADEDLTGMQRDIQVTLEQLCRRLRDLDATAYAAKNALDNAIAAETEDELLRQRLKRLVSIIQQVASKAEKTAIHADELIVHIQTTFAMTGDMSEPEQESPVPGPQPANPGVLSDTENAPGSTDTGVARPLHLISDKEPVAPSANDGDELPKKPTK